MKPWAPLPEFYLAFPQLLPARTNWKHTSDASRRYNCIALSMDDESRIWWPHPGTPSLPVHWPDQCPMEETLAAFIRAFELSGYSICQSEVPEPGVEKIAIFVDSLGEPTHAAKQLNDGTGWWKSKLGWQNDVHTVDIEHELHAVGGGCYGTVARVMARRMQTDAV